MPAEQVTYEDSDFFGSLFPLQEEIHTVVHHSRAANARFNVRELIAPMLFSGEIPITKRSVFCLRRAIATARQDLALLEEKLSLLATELASVARGGAI